MSERGSVPTSRPPDPTRPAAGPAPPEPAPPEPVAPEREAWVALGANLGERRATVERALARLAAEPGVRLLAASRLVETPPVGGPPGQPTFLNGVARLATTLAPHALLARLLAIEAALGRVRSPGVVNGPRTIDLDLLLVEGARCADERLDLPHPRLEERAFVLAPLAELAPGLVLPSGRTAARALAELETPAGTPDRDGGAR